MPSDARGDPARPHKGHDLELLSRPQDRDRGVGDEKMLASASNSVANRDKIRCLDGLRGIACLIVFNYHFFWPWTPAIMLGYGAWLPRSPEPNWEWPTLPIVCLLHRGHPMVVIFFAISGYVLCRHILRTIHEKRVATAYQALASSVFRRIFRLYTPPTISMFLVAILAQVGVFRSEDAIFKGPDSVYINGTITLGYFTNTSTCVNGTASVLGASGVADYLGVQGTEYLNYTQGWEDLICLNASSKTIGPSSTYQVLGGLIDEITKLAELAELANTTTNDTLGLDMLEKPALEERSSVLTDLGNSTNATIPNMTWIQMGGSWEEHPFIHDNMTYALKNFTRAYAEWANPFNFGHYHPRYDPHTFTIPMEFRGSMVVYIFLLGTAALKAKWRLRFAGLLSLYSLFIGRWDIATFMGGALFSEMDIRRSDPTRASSSDPTLVPPVTAAGAIRGRHTGSRPTTAGGTVMRWALIFVALFFLSYPDAGAEWTPGFAYLSTWVPRYYVPLAGWMFYQSIGALLLLHCVLRSPVLCSILEGRVAQYLGKISFSLYLVHGPVLHSLGFWIMPRLFECFGRTVGFAVGWVILFTVTMYLTNLWHERVDAWSTTVGKRIEKALLD